MMQRVVAAITSVLDVRAWAHLLRMVHFWRYSHVDPLRRASLGRGVRMSPTASLRNGGRITIGDGAHVGERSCLWAGDSSGRIDIGTRALFGPEVFITASNYETAPGVPVMDQPRREADVRIGEDVWLGARVTVLPGVTIGDGCIVGAGAVVADDLPPGAVAVGVPARVVSWRGPAPS